MASFKPLYYAWNFGAWGGSAIAAISKTSGGTYYSDYSTIFRPGGWIPPKPEALGWFVAAYNGAGGTAADEVALSMEIYNMSDALLETVSLARGQPAMGPRIFTFYLNHPGEFVKKYRYRITCGGACHLPAQPYTLWKAIGELKIKGKTYSCCRLRKSA